MTDRATPAWNLEFDIDWTDWDSLNTAELARGSVSIPQTFNWRSGFDFLVGATHKLKNGYSPAGGIGYGQNAVPDAFHNPMVPGLDPILYSIGVGRQRKRWEWNVAYRGFYGLPRTVRNSAVSPIGVNADGRYEALGHFLLLSLGRKF